MKTILLTREYWKYFLAAFALFSCLLLLHIVLTYGDDLVGKNLPVKVIVEFLFFTLFSVCVQSFLFATLFAGILTTKRIASLQAFDYKKNIKNDLRLMAIASVLLFGYCNWVVPKAKMEMTILLYNIRSVKQGEQVNRVDNRAIFENSKSHAYRLTIADITEQIKEQNAQIKRYVHICDSLLIVLPDSVAREQYSSLALEKYGISFPNMQNADQERNSKAYNLEHYRTVIDRYIKEKQKYILEIAKRAIVPIELLVLFLIGVSLGYFYYDQKRFLLITLSLFVMGLFLGLINSIFGYIEAQVFGNIIYMVSATVLLFAFVATFVVKCLRK